MAECRTCGGTGEVDCIQCYGSGKHGSDPKKPCAYCKGTRKQRCYDCGGAGKNKSTNYKSKSE